MDNLPEVIENDEDNSGYDFDKLESNDGFISNRIDNAKDSENFEEFILHKNSAGGTSNNNNNNRPTTSKPKN
jgi:hypothetical protein